MRTTFLLAALVIGCSVGDEPPARPAGVYGMDAEGRIAITANEAWPNRPPEPLLPPAADLARACVLLHACLGIDAATCAAPAPREEENAIPWKGYGDRLRWLIDVALEPGMDCATLRRSRTELPPWIHCASEGCVSEKPEVEHHCEGDVAVFRSGSATYRRDCTHAFTTCDATSPTGCKDRPLLRCDPVAGDRCDGTIHLGCRMSGWVSFRDCGIYGGRCEETGPGLNDDCAYPKRCEEGWFGAVPPTTCDGTHVRLCSRGLPFSIDCAALGFTSCVDGKCT